MRPSSPWQKSSKTAYRRARLGRISDLPSRDREEAGLTRAASPDFWNLNEDRQHLSAVSNAHTSKSGGAHIGMGRQRRQIVSFNVHE